MSFVAVDSDRIRMRSFLKYFYVFQPRTDVVMFLDCKDAEEYIMEKNIDILFTAEGDEYMAMIQRLHSVKPFTFSAVLTEDSLDDKKKLVSQNLAVVSRKHFTEVAEWVMAKSDELTFLE